MEMTASRSWIEVTVGQPLPHMLCKWKNC